MQKPISHTYTHADVHTVAKIVLHEVSVRGRSILALHGDLGAGKTTLVSAIAAELGVHESVISPTFIVYRVYEIPQHASWAKLVHIDAYRLEGEHDTQKIRLHELLEDPTNLVCIEWPEHLGAAPQRGAVHVYLTYTEGDARTIEII